MEPREFIITYVVPIVIMFVGFLIAAALKSTVSKWIEDYAKNHPFVTILVALLIYFALAALIHLFPKTYPTSSSSVETTPASSLSDETPSVTDMPSSSQAINQSTPMVPFPTEAPLLTPTVAPESWPNTETGPEAESDPTSTPIPTPIKISDSDIANARLNSTEAYLYLAGGLESYEYDFNIKNKMSSWKYEWYSLNEDVAIVDDTGLAIATGVGATKINVDIIYKGETIKTLSATVIVKDNIKELEISNIPFRDLLVGEDYNFDRSFVTFSGSTTVTSSITRWKVEPYTATITDKGLFEAIEARSYTITAMAFESNNDYEEWIATGNYNLILASHSVTISVIPGYDVP